VAVQPPEALLCFDLEASRATQDLGDVLWARGREEDRNDPLVLTSGVIELLAQNVALPGYPEAFAWLVGGSEAALIGLGANHQDEIRFVDSSSAPAGPTLRWCRLVLIEPGVNPMVTEPVAECQHPILMLWGIMAVADE
jgi:hypothetical protein